MSMTRWKITVEYDGTNYSGWQKQDNVSTIQGVIEEALRGFCQQEIAVTGAGRTDAGVHARGQVAHFDLDYGDRPLNGFELMKALNAHLRDHAISVLQAEEADPEFHARFSAHDKLYRYVIIHRSSPLTVDEGRAWHFYRSLDVAAMQSAAPVLLGKHDFTTFRDSECQAKSPVKTLDDLKITSRPYDDCGGVKIHIEAQAKSFLHHMVRNIVGSLVMVGEGKWSAEDLQAALEACDRTKGGSTAPAAGLYMLRVGY